MRSCFGCIVLMLLFHTKVISQHHVSTSVSVTKMDFFHGLEYQFQPNRFSFEIAGEYGIKATYFIRNLYTRFRIGSVYNVLKLDKFQLGPKLNYAFSVNKLHNSSRNTITANEMNTGLEWRYGQKWFVGNSILIGGMVERRFNTLYDKYHNHVTLSYVFQLNVGYAF
ncbi:MAG TPA: hypothetical protein VKZ44_06635 [Taishania sp.]|nr:hypothetical protein [Taishania sp.]